MIKLVSHCSLLLFLVLPLCSIIAQETDYKKWEENYAKGKELLSDGQTKEAIPFLEQAYEIAENDSKEIEKNLGELTFILGKSYSQIGIWESALKYYQKSILSAKKIQNDTLYLKRLSESTNVYLRTGDYEIGRDTLISCLNYSEQLYGKKTEEYAANLRSLSDMHKRLDDLELALETINESIGIIEGLYGKENLKLSNYKTTLTQIYADLGDYNRAIKVQDEVLSFYKSVKDKQSRDYGVALFSKAYYHEKIRDFSTAILLYKQVKNIFEPDEDGHIYANANIGQAYTDSGNYEKALEYILMALEKTSFEDRSYRQRVENLAYLYVKLGDYEKGQYYYEIAKTWMIKRNKQKDLLYGKLLNNIGKMYRQMGDLEKAQPLFKEALDIFLSIESENHIQYGYQLNDYANTLFELNQYDEALNLLKKNIELSEKNKRTHTQEHFNWQFNLANAYNNLERYNEALPLAKVATQNTKSILGDDHPIYGRMLKGLSQSYIGLNNTDEAIPIIKASNAIFINEINKVFRFRSEKEKRDFLKVVEEQFDETQSIPFLSKMNSQALNSINLNNQFLLKGLLLNNSKGVLTQLQSLDDPFINDNIHSYRSLKDSLERTLSQPFEDRNFDVDSLKNVINQRESELVKMHSNRFNKNLDLEKDWTLSKEYLQSNDIAVEFAHFEIIKNGKSTGSTIYTAYIFKQDWQHPKIISLFEEKQLKILLDGHSPNELYTSNDLYNLIWKPLEGDLDNVSNIYFSPSGLLNQIPFAALQDNAKTVASQYNLVQLSSTAVLKNQLTDPKLVSTLFIGGIDYDYTEAVELDTDSNDLAYLNTESLTNSRATRSRGESWTYLPGSLSEIEGLQQILISKQKPYSILTGKQATEANFKKLSGNSPNIIHIATHGFFYENLDRKPMYSNMGLNTEDRYRLAEDPLLRSGIILAGANYAWKNGSNPNEDEDGILSAMEISNLDLSNTDMVVLSACETGLGDIDGSEGVYGLQRAFKMAGVDIIVMSLWQVPDWKTAEFMNLFYSDWMSTKNVREAFNKAQRNMQKKYKDEPEKWAAFVLFE